MPNWCYNRVRIDADSDQVEQLKEIHEIFENHKTLLIRYYQYLILRTSLTTKENYLSLNNTRMIRWGDYVGNIQFSRW